MTLTRIKHLNVELPFENKFLQSFEELVKRVTHALAKLNLDWPNEQEMIVHSKIDDHFLTSS